jgi:glutamyl-tRNA(Gln) amidotransferase subunit D
VDYLTGGVKASMTAGEIFGAVPEAAGLADLKFTNLMNKLSEDMVPKNWAAIAAGVHKLLRNSEGVVVLHGTDTMHYTASALSFMLDTPKPVVLTGAQRSSDRPSSDAYMNVLCSINTAKSDVGEVVVCFHASTSDDFCHVIRGNRAFKGHSSARWAFRSINVPPLARVWPDGKFEKLSDYTERKKGKGKLLNKVEPRVALVKVFPGASPDVLNHYASKGYKGIVIEGTGLGHVPVNPDGGRGWIPTIKELRDDMLFVVTSQTLWGRTHKHVYTNLRKLSRLGVLFVGDMIPETAYTKLVWALGNFSRETAGKIMKKNVRGELSARTTLVNQDGSIE